MGLKKKKILIGEDERPMAKALELKLNGSGYDAKAVYDGEQVLETLRNEKFDLLVLDLIMPKMDGFEVLETIQEEKIDVMVAVASNLGQEEDVKRSKDLGAVDYFVKADTPISVIVQRIERILKKG